MPTNVAIPQCFVDVYPFEGGNYSITGGHILRCQVSKNIKQDAGTFTFNLVPGGPFGVDTGPSWSEIITPNSLVVIAMARWQYRQVAMLGVVRTVSESQLWTDKGVIRTIAIAGEDFSYYFNSQSYFAWNFLASTFSALLAPQLGENAAALPFNLGILQGTPDSVAAQWYNLIFAGAQGLLSKTLFAYRNGSVSFTQAVGAWFEKYPGVEIPMSDYFIATEERFMEKFRKILPFPFYETFVITAPPNTYPAAPASYRFASAGLGADFPAQITFVGRVNPLPRVTVDVSGQAAQFSTMDMARWNALSLFQPDAALIESQLQFSTDEVRNFYAMIPTWYASLYGGSNSNTSSLLFLSAGAVDINSIHRYGYRPAWQTTNWWSDPSGVQAEMAAKAPSDANNLTKMVWDLMTRVYSYHEPAALMGYAAVRAPLRPDILPGCRYRYQPLKAEEEWDFYIDGVQHDFVFGGPSTTSLTLSRGFPTSVYADASENGVLRQAHLGNAQRFNGGYKIGLPKIITQQTVTAQSTNLQQFGGIKAISQNQTTVQPGLQILPFNSPSALNALQAQAAQIFVTPQGQ